MHNHNFFFSIYFLKALLDVEGPSNIQWNIKKATFFKTSFLLNVGMHKFYLEFCV